MSTQPLHDDEDDNGEVFLDASDIVHEVAMDNEDLPEADDDSELEDEDDGDFVHKFTAHTGELYSVACSPTDVALVATGGGDDKGFLWKIGQGDWAFELQGHEDSVSSLAFSYDGQRLASGSLDGTIKVWDVSRNFEGINLEGPGGSIEWLRWHPRGHLLLAGSDDFSIWMWNTDTAAFLNTFIGHGNSVTCGDFTPDGKLICTGSDDATLRVWNPRSGESIHVVQGHPYHTEGLTCLTINSTSTLALSGSKDGSVHIVNITTGNVVDNNALASHSDSIECVGFAPSGSWAAVGGMDKNLIIWDIEHLLPRGTCEHEDGVTCLAWLGASYVATGCVDGKVRVWDSRSGECVKTFKGHSDCIQSLSVSANRDYLVSASIDGTACAFEVENFR
ncbi:angio-associated migratory cell protein [Cajanus cajan]|uniref:angio-associated migratory cell protein n=1 Tax=Cajanus cajan TaxID=3821 RepID=UPI00098DCC06|nr:angio-associated migratory cell protein [Cajanus cajan]